jgi:5-methylcytosine-specific restriction enzyme subunit McrC
MPITPKLSVVVAPKVAVENVFRMLEYAYDLDIVLPQRDTQVATLRDFYDRLAQMLANRVHQRSKQGVFRTYEAHAERLPTVRGRLDSRELMRQPVNVALPCEFEQFSADTPTNQIIHWTLRHILRTGLCRPETQRQIRHVYNTLSGLVTPTPFMVHDCVGRSYTRLNEDYRPMHLLCHFFLDNSGPSHQLGDTSMLPFLIDMAALFEKFVARWLEKQLPAHLALSIQEHKRFESGAMTIDIDLVIRERLSRRVVAVLDTKYKHGSKPSNEDVYQIAFYANSLQCREAGLIYPAPLRRRLDEMQRDIHIRSLVFDLSGDLDVAGQRFLDRLHLTEVA